ncbi:unnamed protein product [Staurois parvus]|uniref:NADH dehydrogenase subunit 4L n=1 Tax=Staurois parvus TaxID=386267 RepID=A0ABN9BPJ2_9NEOB|nr:unnamed protein product [Staurois parvus]
MLVILTVEPKGLILHILVKFCFILSCLSLGGKLHMLSLVCIAGELFFSLGGCM